MRLQVRKASPLAVIPQHQSAGAAGLDLHASEAATIEPDCRVVISTGLSMAIPRDFCGMVCSRSGLAVNHGVFVLNSPGVIDRDFRGVVKVILFNCGLHAFSIKVGDRIAQLLVVPVAKVEIDEVEELLATDRGSGGFGSTGI